jgi:hypothetical protein
MSEFTENYVNNLMNYSYSPSKRKTTFQSGSGNYKWRSKSGVVDMRSMSIEHLHNAIKVATSKQNTGKLDQLREVLHEKQSMPQIPRR